MKKAPRFKGTKKDRIIYWIFTTIVVLFDGVGAIFFYTPFARQGIRAMGFPEYFGTELGIAKILGGIILILPMIPARFKEWAYVGFGISTFSAIIANLVVFDAVHAAMPLVVLIFFVVSYIYYHKITD